jgi:glutaredoxin
VPEVVTRVRTEVVIVSTNGCHLCEEAHRCLEAMGVIVRRVDVFSPEGRKIVRNYRTALVPIIVVGERLVSSGRFDAADVERALALKDS